MRWSWQTTRPPARPRSEDRERRAELERLLREHRGNVAGMARARQGLDSYDFRG